MHDIHHNQSFEIKLDPHTILPDQYIQMFLIEMNKWSDLNYD